MLTLLIIAFGILIYTALSPVHSRTSPNKDDGTDVINAYKRVNPKSVQGPFIYLVVLVLYKHFMPSENFSFTGVKDTVRQLRRQ